MSKWVDVGTRMSTELELSSWRYGQVQAERLCCAILILQEFMEVDPQAPLGGPDGKKDILCVKSGIKYVAAAYFPTTAKAFSDVKAKFIEDFKGVESNGRDGFIFLTNQHLTVQNREELLSFAAASTRDCQILHLERIRAILDQPSGYGIRLEFLRIALSPEEQFAYFTRSRDDVERNIERQAQLLRTIDFKLDKLLGSQDFVVQTIKKTAANAGIDITPPPSRPDLFLGGLYKHRDEHDVTTSLLSVPLLLSFHRAICFDVPAKSIGQIRTERVYLAQPGMPPGKAVAVPPEPHEVPELLTTLCDDWRGNLESLQQQSFDAKLAKIAQFHAEFLRIHPFLDGNGRIARFILMQQCLDLFGVADMGVLDKGAEYFAALQAADQGDFTFLVRVLRPIAGDQ